MMAASGRARAQVTSAGVYGSVAQVNIAAAPPPSRTAVCAPSADNADAACSARRRTSVSRPLSPVAVTATVTVRHSGSRRAARSSRKAA
ncbi:hypothetical protein DVH21_28875 [Micromonospora aurantiaca]|uniref:Uncharacterized protein n=1 Tax=Micromonospora aurantiaca (nom. illeg.) TaxID=47850 RepID=A0A6N3KAU2_9ACTN|nr:hypothetical protein DVH21_28875 [Micromonospora aurantiaca]